MNRSVHFFSNFNVLTALELKHCDSPSPSPPPEETVDKTPCQFSLLGTCLNFLVCTLLSPAHKSRSIAWILETRADRAQDTTGVVGVIRSKDVVFGEMLSTVTACLEVFHGKVEAKNEARE